MRDQHDAQQLATQAKLTSSRRFFSNRLGSNSLFFVFFPNPAMPIMAIISVSSAMVVRGFWKRGEVDAGNPEP
jgi:hypothetical protein